MEWLEQNIDAYRIVSEILGQLRLTVRQRLEQIHGEEWYKKGLPEEVFKRLIAAKEREKSIDWYEGQYQEIMDYAVFADLLEILEHSPEAFPSFTGLAPSTALLNARFLELDVMRAKLGRARPISETELSFLGTFHLRFRKAVQEAKEDSGDVPPPAQPAVGAPKVSAPEPEVIPEPEPAAASEPEIEEVPPPDPVEEVQPPAEPSSRPKRPVQTDVGGSATARETEAVEESPGANASLSAEDDIPTNALGDESSDAKQDDDLSPAEPTGPVDEISKTIGPKKLREALSTNDHRTVLRELYREVTAIAEGVWSSEVTPASLVWDQVTSSDWYERNFSRLGLQPLSVFYEVTAKVDKKVRAGAERKELQEFLKETNFAKTLLSLRDMFQANNI
jgi:outer membrane biosynthesis protein TonB